MAATKTLTSLGPLRSLSRVRKGPCARNGCTTPARLALVQIVTDIDDGMPGWGGVRLCGPHLEEAVVRLDDYDRKEARGEIAT